MVSNMDKAVQFYTKTLGLALVEHYGEHYAEVKAPDLFIGLHPSPADTVMGNNLSIGFGVTEFDAVFEELSASGINLKEEKDGWIRLAHFTDPDGNHLFLAERK